MVVGVVEHAWLGSNRVLSDVDQGGGKGKHCKILPKPVYGRRARRPYLSITPLCAT
jgi:hypothetical protein